jgi:carbamate kinase
MLTDVEGIMRDFGTDAVAPIERPSPEAAAAPDLAAGSMGAKAEAAARFAATRTGKAHGDRASRQGAEYPEGTHGNARHARALPLTASLSRPT